MAKVKRRRMTEQGGMIRADGGSFGFCAAVGFARMAVHLVFGVSKCLLRLLPRLTEGRDGRP